MRKILIVDDDVTSVAIVKALLSDEFDVVTANSGLEALGHLQKDPDLSLILLDMIMPGASGMDVLKALKGSDSWSEIPVIFLTSMEKMRVELEGFAADFIQKPVNADLLRLKIKRQLFIRDLKMENQHLQKTLQQIKSRVDQIFDEAMQ